MGYIASTARVVRANPETKAIAIGSSVRNLSQNGLSTRYYIVIGTHRQSLNQRARQGDVG